MWELNDPEIRDKIANFAKARELVVWSLSAERDIGKLAGITHLAILEGLVDHIVCGYSIEADYMRNGDLAYIFRCFVGRGRLYVKLKFVQIGADERMHIFSAHPDR